MIHRSASLYRSLLLLYPKSYRQEFGGEMEFVFRETLKDAYSQNGQHGIIYHWFNTIIDVVKSVAIQHLERHQEGDRMKNSQDLLMRNEAFGWLAAATMGILIIPFLGMQFGPVNWTLSDFVIMGGLIFTMGSIFILTARKVTKNRLLVGIVIALLFLWIWAELAVGVFTNIGS